jgi:hypothetical protein
MTRRRCSWLAPDIASCPPDASYTRRWQHFIGPAVRAVSKPGGLPVLDREDPLRRHRGLSGATLHHRLPDGRIA